MVSTPATLGRITRERHELHPLQIYTLSFSPERIPLHRPPDLDRLTHN